MNYAMVLHHFWNRAGGGEVVCASTACTFEYIGYLPVLASPITIEVEEYPVWFGLDLTRYPKYSWNIKLRAFGIYLRLLLGYVGVKAIKKFNPEIVFVDSATYSVMINECRNRNIKLIEYIHYPFEAFEIEDPYIKERYSKFPLNIYWKLFTKILPHYIRSNPFEIASLVLANSIWTADIVKEIYNEKPIVLNPPLPPNVKIIENLNPFENRNNIIIMVGRFSEEKRYHWVLESVIYKLRKEIENVKLYIFGGTKTRSSIYYLSKLKNIALKNGFKVSDNLNIDADIYLISNAPRSIINHIVNKAKVFFHATINEHWGISVAEAMARGLPVVVHKSGGTWSDLVDNGKYGSGYTTAEEAIELLAKTITDNIIWKKYSVAGINKAKQLTLDKYINNFHAILQ